MKKELGLSTPWDTCHSEIVAMFGDDPDIEINYDEEANAVEMRVQGQDKANALAKIMPSEKKFGNVSMQIKVIPANKLEDPRGSLFQKAFEGNPVLSFVKTVPAFGGEITYVVFKNKVVQFYNDDISDIYGNESTLYENIARDIFEVGLGVSFCTDMPGVE